MNPFNFIFKCDAHSRPITGVTARVHYKVTSTVQSFCEKPVIPVILLIKGAYSEIAGGAVQATFTLSARATIIFRSRTHVGVGGVAARRQTVISLMNILKKHKQQRRRGKKEEHF